MTPRACLCRLGSEKYRVQASRDDKPINAWGYSLYVFVFILFIQLELFCISSYNLTNSIVNKQRMIMELELVDNSTLETDKDKDATQGNSPYNGPERRIAHRRCGHDRRTMVRFELDKPDRRQKEDRRTTTNVWDKGHTMF